MPGKPKPKDPGVGVRRSTRERKKLTFGSDYEVDDPEHPPSKKQRTEPDPQQPGTSAGGGGVPPPPLPSLDDPDPTPDPKEGDMAFRSRVLEKADPAD